MPLSSSCVRARRRIRRSRAHGGEKEFCPGPAAKGDASGSRAAGADFIGELINTFLDDAPQLIQQLHTALAGNDAETFKRAAHSLKSNAASFGANDLSARAKELEMLGRENKLNEVADQLKALEEAYQAAAQELKGMSA